ncbi:hypothetical protein [Spirosoma lituiforme]
MQTEHDAVGKAGQLIAFESRYATSPTEVKTMNTKQIRQLFLIVNLFVADLFSWVLSFLDRYHNARKSIVCCRPVSFK